MKLFSLFLAGCFLLTTAFAENNRILRLQTADDVGIAAGYYPASGDSAAPAAVLLHDFESSRSECGTFPVLLQHNGIAVLSLDLRGHGDSTRRITAGGPEPVDFHTLKQKDFQNMMFDINAAMDWLEDQPGVDKKRIALIGSGLGANLAVRYAHQQPGTAALVLLSPGLAYKDVRIDEVFPQLPGLPLRVAVCVQDSFAYESSRRLLDLRKQQGRVSDLKEMIVCSGSLHGGEMLRGVKELPGVLALWLRQVLLGSEE